MGPLDDVVIEASVNISSKKSIKKRRAPQQLYENDAQLTLNMAHGKDEDADRIQIEDSEPTMADKLATLDLHRKVDTEAQETVEHPQTQPPSADSVHVLLGQALHTDDRSLLLDCLYNQDDKVIANSVSLLSAVEIFKLLDSLLSIIQSRGAVLVCVLPWLRSLLLLHSSRIMSQESSLAALNSLYQVIESRVTNMNPALNLASSLDLLCAGVDDDGVEEYDSVPPVIYEDNDESEEEESEADAMETDDEETKELDDLSGLSDADLSEDL